MTSRVSINTTVVILSYNQTSGPIKVDRVDLHGPSSSCLQPGTHDSPPTSPREIPCMGSTITTTYLLRRVPVYMVFITTCPRVTCRHR